MTSGGSSQGNGILCVVGALREREGRGAQQETRGGAEATANPNGKGKAKARSTARRKIKMKISGVTQETLLPVLESSRTGATSKGVGREGNNWRDVGPASIDEEIMAAMRKRRTAGVRYRGRTTGG